MSRSPLKASMLVRPCGTGLNYEVHGTHYRDGGIPVLILARGGMQSSIATLNDAKNPWNPLQRLSLEKYMLIAMDQRMSNIDTNLSDNHDVGWTTFRDDQIALLDHLGIKGEGQCRLLGSCIGPSYALQLLRDYPTRFDKAVLMQPIGVSIHTTEPETWEGLNTGSEEHWFGSWGKKMIAGGRASQVAIDKLYQNMFGGPRWYDFVFTVTREDVKMRIPHSLLVLCGRDIYHPAETAREISRLAQDRTTLIEEWRGVGPEKLAEAEGAIEHFLSS